jgi:hypothetical protein
MLIWKKFGLRAAGARGRVPLQASCLKHGLKVGRQYPVRHVRREQGSPQGRCGGRASASLPLLDDMHRHRLRRGASQELTKVFPITQGALQVGT